jgi:hypothetical protein
LVVAIVAVTSGTTTAVHVAGGNLPAAKLTFSRGSFGNPTKTIWLLVVNNRLIIG